MPISDLARELKMSYMGIKQHCVKLTAQGYLEEKRLPKAGRTVGRPEKLYRLTKKCDELFPQASGEMTLAILDAVHDLYGDAAPERLLLVYLQNLEKKWASKLKTATSAVDKATRLTSLRETDGWFNRCHLDPKTGFCIEEFHSPLTEIFLRYPNLVRLEVQMMEHLIGNRVTREEKTLPKGGKITVWQVHLLGGGNSQTKAPPKKEGQAETGDLFGFVP